MTIKLSGIDDCWLTVQLPLQQSYSCKNLIAFCFLDFPCFTFFSAHVRSYYDWPAPSTPSLHWVEHKKNLKCILRGSFTLSFIHVLTAVLFVCIYI